MIESSYYSKITKYYLKNATNSIAWEAKFSRSGRIRFDALQDHQEEKLLKAEKIYGEKIADSGLLKKPFDGWVLYKAKSYFIAIYFTPRETEIYEIPIRIFLKEKYTSTEKSLSKQRAKELGKILNL